MNQTQVAALIAELNAMPAGLYSCDANGSACNSYVAQWKVVELAEKHAALAQQAQDQHNTGPEFTVSDPDLDNLLNLAANLATGNANQDTGMAWLSALEAVESRMTHQQAQEPVRVLERSQKRMVSGISDDQRATINAAYTTPPAPQPALVPEGYALIHVDALRAWGKLDEVKSACAYPGTKPAPVPQPAVPVVSDDILIEREYERVMGQHLRPQDRAGVLEVCRAILALRPQAVPMTDAARDVLAERHRQISTEGWTPEHDDVHDFGELSAAAACYALHTYPVGNVGDYLRFWPWASEWWKPSDRRRNLIKAGALILAEIERLDRANGITAKAEGGA